MRKENSDFIEKYAVELFNIFKGYQPEKQYDITLSKDGKKNLVYKNNSAEITLHSRYNVEREVNNFCESIDESKDVIFVIGFGFGYHIKELVQKFGTSKEIIVLEFDKEIFNACLEEIDVSDLLIDKRMQFYFVKDILNMAKIIVSYIHQGLDIGLYFLNSYKVIHNNIENLLNEKVKYLLQDVQMNLRVQHYTSDIWIENYIKNLPHILRQPSVESLRNQYMGIPGIVVCAGPSLNKNIEILKNNLEKCIVFSAGSAIGPLNKHNIKPHYTVGLDGWDSNMKIYNDDIDISETTLISSTEFYYKVVEKFKDRSFFYTSSPDTYNFLNRYFDKNIIGYSANFSVSYNALQVAHTLGCNPIIIIGQDLCFYDKNYADGAAFIKGMDNDSSEGNEFIDENDIYGNLVKTDRVFLGVKKAFEYWAKNNKDENRKLYNCTEGGLNLEGYENRKLIEILEDKPLYKQKSKSEQIIVNIDDLSIANDMNRLSSDLKEYLKVLKKKSNECNKYSIDIKKNNLKETIKNTKKINDDYKTVVNNEMYIAFRLSISNTLEAYLSDCNRKIGKITDDYKKAEIVIGMYQNIYKYLVNRYVLIDNLIDKTIKERGQNE